MIIEMPYVTQMVFKEVSNLSLWFQALGIMLELVGLGLTIRLFGSIFERWVTEVTRKGYVLTPSVRAQLAKEGRKIVIPMGVVMLGLVFQLVGLFIYL